MRVSVVGAVTALLLCASAASAQVADGVYNFINCSGAALEGQVTVKGDKITFYESRCTLTNPEPVRGMTGAVLYDAQCTGEGTDWTDRMLLMPTDSGEMIRVESGFALSYKSCQ